MKPSNDNGLSWIGLATIWFGGMISVPSLLIGSAGVLGSLLAASGIFANFMGFLMLLTLMVPPIAGVLVSDYWIARSYTSRALGGFNMNGITAWGAGVAAMLLVTHPLRSVLGIVVSGAVYFVMVKLRPAATARALT